MAKGYDARTEETLALTGALENAAVVGVPVRWLYPELVPDGRRWHCTIRRARDDGEPLPPLVQAVIQKWVWGSSARWIARRFSIDQATVRRWVYKHPWAVRAEIERTRKYGAANEYELKRRQTVLRGMGVLGSG